MKKFIIGFFCIILLNLLIVLAFNISIKYIISDIISSSAVKGRINDMINNYIGDNNLDANQLISSDDINDFISKYLELIIDDGNDKDTIDILGELIEKNRDKIKSYGVRDEDIDGMLDKIKNNESYNNSYITYNLTNEQRIALNIYRIMSSNSLKILVGIGICLCCGLILIINKMKSFKNIGIVSLIAGGMIKSFCFLMNKIFSLVEVKEVMGNIDINFNYLDKFVYIYIIAGVCLIVIYIIINKFTKEVK